MIKDIENMLKKAENSKRPINDYVGNEDLMAYVRVTKRYIEGEMVKTLEIANVSVDEDLQGRGIFKKFLQIIETLAKKYERMVYIESVLNDILINKLPSYGYTQLENSNPPSFIKTP